MYPLEKYRFYINGRTVYAESTYAGKRVKGKAVCAPEDEFDLEKGKQIAAARCAIKIAKKRCARAKQKYQEAVNDYLQSSDHWNDMNWYRATADMELKEVEEHLKRLL